MSYALDELLAMFRQRMDDVETPYLWTDDEVYEYLDEAAAEFSEEIDVLAATVDVPYVAGQEAVTQPIYATRIRAAHVGTKKLNLFNAEQWDSSGCSFGSDYGNVLTGPSENWDTDTAEEPKALITDFNTGELRLYPIPTTAGTLSLRMYRKPIKFMQDGEAPEIVDRQHQRAIVLGARAYAYLKHDSETYNLDAHRTMHEHFLGRIEKLRYRVQRRDRRAGTVAYGGL